ncbi:MAG: YebC/PmpR family DNA-binding transcriptional regulator [Clostridia bacterium]|nr:YebC/PmpR family DNA-binding transcriptional regulator [Clostridia bacterium]
MSGHSKWATIKRDKAKTDAARGNVFTKIGREIAIAVKNGGPDPANNPRLATVVAKARANNMPNDNIQRSIKKASGELGQVNYEELVYEGYGPGGSAVMCDIVTDNKNRTSSDIRHILDKAGGSLAGPGSVSYLFTRKAVVVIEAQKDMSEDDITMLALEADADDVSNDGEGIFTVYGQVPKLQQIKQTLEKSNLKILSAEIEQVPNDTITLDDSKYESFEKMLDKLEENDDVQNVYHNVELK